MRRDYCYYQCPEQGAIHIGLNDGDSHWICFFHYTKWNAQRARFLAMGFHARYKNWGNCCAGEHFSRRCSSFAHQGHTTRTTALGTSFSPLFLSPRKCGSISRIAS
jgi:hypothetical protein